MRKWLIFFLLLAQSCQYQPAFCQNISIDLKTISTIESSNNPIAYNKKSGAIGLYQITSICLQDYNNYHRNKITKKMLYKPFYNELVADWYLNERIPQLLKYYHKNITINNILVAYNCGINCVEKPLPKETINYISKYHKLNGN